jgi:hypothetical protein
MKATYQFIVDLSHALEKTDRYLKASELAKILNYAGFKTSYNTEYCEEPSRGIHKVLSSAYKAIEDEYGEQQGHDIAGRFTDENGNTPWW